MTHKLWIYATALGGMLVTMVLALTLRLGGAGTGDLAASRAAVEPAAPDPQILAAIRRARERLLREVKPRFLRGLAPGEQLLVKAPVRAEGGGREWVWVDVQEWRGEQLTGVVRSEPPRASDAAVGAAVVIEESALFDYFLTSTSGREGDETGALMMRLDRRP